MRMSGELDYLCRHKYRPTRRKNHYVWHYNLARNIYNGQEQLINIHSHAQAWVYYLIIEFWLSNSPNKIINSLVTAISLLCLNKRWNYTKSIKLFPTQRELKGLEAQVISSRHNLSTYIHVCKALIDENGYSRSRPCLNRFFFKLKFCILRCHGYICLCTK